MDISYLKMLLAAFCTVSEMLLTEKLPATLAGKNELVEGHIVEKATAQSLANLHIILLKTI